MLTKEKVADRVYAIYGDTQEEVGKAFVRFQEYYENKDLKGIKNITIRMVEDWWAGECKGQEEQEPYYTYWTGFNLPGNIILTLMSTSEFRSGFSLSKFLTGPREFPRWYKQEDELINLLQDLTADQIINSYLIGLAKNSTHVFDHELAHAMWATDPVYKAVQTVNMSKLPPDIYERFRKDLTDSGYHPSVVRDEMQAYMSTYTDTLLESFETSDYDAFTTPFEATFKDFVEINKSGFKPVAVLPS